jgi:hypothetical protein
LCGVAGFFAMMKNMTKMCGCLCSVAGCFAMMKNMTKLSCVVVCVMWLDFSPWQRRWPAAEICFSLTSSCGCT